MFDRREELADTPAAALALDCLEAGIRAARPEAVVPDAAAVEGDRFTVGDSVIDLTTFEKVLVLGGGKAASQVARELERLLGDRIDGGVVVTDDPVDCERVRVLPGDHPTPSERGVESTQELLAAAEAADESTLVLGVITGGGSSLLAAPAAGITLAALQETTEALLASGASIGEMNAVRKHCSAVKGGQLAAATAPATVVCLVLSDVIGNDLDTIASGPFVADETTFADALAVLDRYDVTVPPSVRDRLERGRAGEIAETPKAGDPALETVTTHVIGDAMTAMEAAAETVADGKKGPAAGTEPVILSSRIRGEAREAGKSAVAIAEEVVATGNPVEPPAALISGGETTVTLRGDGHGGPNQEFALSAALELDLDTPGKTKGDDRDGSERVVIAAIDTDGIDGPTDAAGAIVQADTIPDAEGQRALADNNAYAVLDTADALLRTGPTGTNVNDLRVIVITDESG